MSLLVLDFDGTMTDAEAEGEAFTAGYLDDLCTLVGRPGGDPEVISLAAKTNAAIAAHPENFPFLWMGRAVAPATVDPYLRMVPIAHAIFDQFGVFRDASDRGRLLGSILYRYNYAKTKPHFRHGAGELLAGLVASNLPVWIVTNSDTEAVANKLRLLSNAHASVETLATRVRGYARKFDIDDAWHDVPAELQVPGLARPVLLRRHTYANILQTLVEQHGTTMRDVTVVGDIFELDLAMPLALGARVGLVKSSHTPAYELAYVEKHERATVIADLAQIPAFAFGRA